MPKGYSDRWQSLFRLWYGSFFVGAAGVLLGFLLLGANVQSIAHAASGQPQMSVQPVAGEPNTIHNSYFLFNQVKGIVENGRVIVRNSGTAVGTVNLYPADAITNPNGGIGYQDQNGMHKGVGAWISLATQKLTLDAGKSQIIPFTVTIPDNATSGQHLGAIVAENVSIQTARVNTTASQKFQFNIRYLSVDAVQINVPGPLHEALAITGVKGGGTQGYQSLLVDIRNTGNVMLDGQGTLQVIDSKGALLQNLPLTVGTVLPGDNINYPDYIKKQALSAGTYRANVFLKYGHNHVVNSSITFTITQKQVNQSFNNQPPVLKQPLTSLADTSLPLWQLAIIGLIGLIGVSTLFYWVYKIMRVVARRTKKNRQVSKQREGEKKSVEEAREEQPEKAMI